LGWSIADSVIEARMDQEERSLLADEFKSNSEFSAYESRRIWPADRRRILRILRDQPEIAATRVYDITLQPEHIHREGGDGFRVGGVRPS